MGKQEKIDRLAGEIWKYISDVWPLVERLGNLPESPMDRKSKGQSNPPIGEYAMLVISVNQDASAKLRPLLDELEKHRAAFGGYRFDLMLLHARYDSGGFLRWLSASNAGPKRRRAFWELCAFVARALLDGRGEHVTLKVISRPKPNEDGGIVIDPSKRLDDVVSDPRLVAPRWRPITAMNAYRAIVGRLERIRGENPGMLEKDVELECQKELEKLYGNSVASSVGRIREAKGFVNKERGEGAA